ncbi:MAG TPA: hypothetical protein VGC14_17955 [Rhizobium sp.]
MIGRLADRVDTIAGLGAHQPIGADIGKAHASGLIDNDRCRQRQFPVAVTSPTDEPLSTEDCFDGLSKV